MSLVKLTNCLAVALFATAMLANTAQAQVRNLDDYSGSITVRNTGGYLVTIPVQYMRFDPGRPSIRNNSVSGSLLMVANNQVIYGTWTEYNGFRWIQLNNFPYNTYMVGRKEGGPFNNAYFRLYLFGDNDGNQLAASNLVIYEN